MSKKPASSKKPDNSSSSDSEEEYGTPKGAYYVDPSFRTSLPKINKSDRVLRSHKQKPVPHSHSTYGTYSPSTSFSQSLPASPRKSITNDSLLANLRDLRKQLEDLSL